MVVLGTLASPGSPAMRPVLPVTGASAAFVEARRPRALALGRALGDHVHDPATLAAELRRALVELADPDYVVSQRFVAPGIGLTHGVRNPLRDAVASGFRSATRRASSSTLLAVADRLLREAELEARWFAFGMLDRALEREPERTWQLLRRAAREAADWITVDTLAHAMALGIVAEPYRWAELEQLVYAPSRWERRLVGSTIATMPFASRSGGRAPGITARALPILANLVGDAEPDVQKALAWAYRSMAVVDRPATTAALEHEADRAFAEADGHRAWVVRDALSKLDPEDARRLHSRLDGLRRRPGTSSTSDAALTAARFAGLGLGGPITEPPLT